MKNPCIDGSFLHLTRLDHLVRVDRPTHLPAAQVAGPWAAPSVRADLLAPPRSAKPSPRLPEGQKGFAFLPPLLQPRIQARHRALAGVIRAPVHTYAPHGNWQSAGLRRRKPGRPQRPSGHGRPMGRPFRLSRRGNSRAKSQPAAARRTPTPPLYRSAAMPVMDMPPGSS